MVSTQSRNVPFGGPGLERAASSIASSGAKSRFTATPDRLVAAQLKDTNGRNQ